MTKLPNLMQGAEPQFYRGNHIGCLVVHGFMASPPEVAWVGQHLAEQGYTVYVPRLTGHGIDPDHMQRMIWQDWYAQVLDGYHILRQQCEIVVAIGHSMGGLLSLLLASDHALDALVVCASPITISDTRSSIRYANLISYAMPFTEHPSEADLNAQIVAEQERRGEAITSRVHYQKWASKAVHQFSLLEKVTREILPQVITPLLLLYAEQDETGSPAQGEHISNAVRSSIVEMHILKEGGHIVFQDKGRDEAFHVVADFVNRMTHSEGNEHA